MTAAQLPANAITVHAEEPNQSDAQILTSADYAIYLKSGHYTINDDVTFKQGLVVQSGETVYIDIPAGKTLTATGKDSYYLDNGWAWGIHYKGLYTFAATAGITVEEGATLHLTGDGNVVATGGAGYSADSGDAGNAYTINFYYYKSWFYSIADKVSLTFGSGGNGGVGAGAPAAGIGGNGGKGGCAPGTNSADNGGFNPGDNNKAVNGKTGVAGGSGGDGGTMGEVYVEDSVKVTAKAGAANGCTNATQGGKFSGKAYSTTSGGNGWKVFASVGAPGGGGGKAGTSPAIGGAGGGGGAGGSGAGNGYTGNHGSVSVSIYNSSNGSNPSGRDGGAGGTTAQPSAAVSGGAGGKGGANGTGGNLYIAAGASVNGISGADLKQSNLGDETNAVNGQAANVKPLTYTTVTVKTDNVVDTGHTVSVIGSGKREYELKQDGDVFVSYLPMGDAGLNVYVDGEDTGYELDLSGATASEEINFYTCTVKVNLDGKPDAGHNVKLIKNNYLVYTMDETAESGVFSNVYLYKNPAADPEINTFDLYVDGKDAKQELSFVYGESLDVNYYTAKVLVTLDGAPWADDSVSVSIRGDGKNVVLSKADTAGEFETVLFETDTTEYNVWVNTDRTSNTVGVSMPLSATVPYYTGTVTVNQDDSPKADAEVIFVSGDKSYTVKNQESGLYSMPLLGEAYPYTLKFPGTIDSSKTTITEDQRSVTADFYSVEFIGSEIDDYNTLTENSYTYKTYIVHTGDKVVKPVGAYLAGMTFKEWSATAYDKTEESLPAPFDFGTPITSRTVIYAHYGDPTVAINGYIKSDEDGTINSEGEYFIMPNLSITGFDEGNIIQTIELDAKNITGMKIPNDANISVSTRDGDVSPQDQYYVFDSDADLVITFAEKVSYVEAQNLLREIIVKPSSEADCTIAFTVSDSIVSLYKESDWTYESVPSEIHYEILSADAHDLGQAGTATYYYVNEDLVFNENRSNYNGLTIAGDVTIYIPEGKKLTVYGQNGSGQNPGRAAILLTEGNTLTIWGKGTVEVYGGDAGDGSAGSNGAATGRCDPNYTGGYTFTAGGAGGAGGSGGGGAGAGIGTDGGAGGTGGAGAAGYGNINVNLNNYDVTKQNVIAGNNPGQAGSAGSGSANAGSLSISSSITTAGGGGQAGIGGARGDMTSVWIKNSKWRVFDYDTDRNTTGGGGGGGGAGGYEASFYGTGGSGGGGGGGGASGSCQYYNGGTYWGQSAAEGGQGPVGQKGADGDHWYDQAAGGAGGAEGVAGSSLTPVEAPDTVSCDAVFDTSYFGGTAVPVSYSAFSGESIVVPDPTVPAGLAFKGWKLVTSGCSVDDVYFKNNGTDDSTVIAPSVTALTLSDTLEGDITLKPLYGTAKSKVASSTLTVSYSDFPTVPTYYTYTVNTELDGTPYNLGTIVLKSGEEEYEIGATKTVGEYSLILDKDTTFDIYIDNKDTLVDVSQGETATVAMKSLKVEIKKDGVGTTSLGGVTLVGDNNTVSLDPLYSEGTATGLFSAYVMDSDAESSYSVYLNNEDTGIDAVPSETAELNYSTVTVNVKSDDVLTDKGLVTLREGGLIKYELSKDASGVYSIVILNSDNYYDIYVGDENTGSSAGIFTGAQYTVNYRTVTIETLKDGASCNMGTVELKSADGKTEVAQTAAGRYELNALEDLTSVYEVYVAGEDTGKTVSFTADYRNCTISYKTLTVVTKTDGTQVSRGSVVLKAEGRQDILMAYKDGSYKGVTQFLDTYNVYVNDNDTGIDLNAAEAAECTLDYYTLHYDLNGGSGSIPPDTLYLSGTAVTLTLTVPKKNEAVFTGWSADGANPVSASDNQIIIGEECHNLTALYNPVSDYEARYKAQSAEEWVYSSATEALDKACSNPNEDYYIELLKDANIEGSVVSGKVSLSVPSGIKVSGSFTNNGTIDLEGELLGSVTNNGTIEGTGTVTADYELESASPVATLVNKAGATVTGCAVSNLSENEGTVTDCSIGVGENISGTVTGVIYAGDNVTFSPDVTTYDTSGQKAVISLMGGGTVSDSSDINNANNFDNLMIVSDGHSFTVANILLRSKIRVDNIQIYADFFDFEAPKNTAYNGRAKTPVITSSRTPGLGSITKIMYKQIVAEDEKAWSKWEDWTEDAPVKVGTYQVMINVADGEYYYGLDNVTDALLWVFTITPKKSGHSSDSDSSDNNGSSADGSAIGNAVPVVYGIEGGHTYCISREFTVTDDNLDYVKLDGIKDLACVDGKYSLPADGKAHSVVVRDKSGNVVIIMDVKVNDHHIICAVGTPKEPTATQDGITAGEKCAVCGQVFTEQEVIPAGSALNAVSGGRASGGTGSTGPVVYGIEGGHTYCVSGEFTVFDDDLDSVKLDGTKELECIDGKYSLPADGKAHSVVIRDKSGNKVIILNVKVNDHHIECAVGTPKEPTATQDGITAGKKCAVCGQVLTEQEVIPAAGSSLNAGSSEGTVNEIAANDENIEDEHSSNSWLWIPVATAVLGAGLFIILPGKRRRNWGPDLFKKK